MGDLKSGDFEAVYALMNASRDQCMLLDKAGYIQTINKRAAEFFGKTQEEMEGTLYWEHLSQEQISVTKERIDGILSTGRSEIFVDFAGARVFEVFYNLIPELPEKVEFIATFTRDITAQFEAEQELIASEARHRRLFNENPVPMYVYDMRTLQILDANTALIKGYGYTRDELTSMTINDIRPSEDVEKVMENVTDLRSKQVHLGLWRHSKKDGSIIDVEITSGDFPYEDKPARLVVCNDVTEKIMAEEAIAESEEKFRKGFITSPDAISISRMEDGVLLEINDGFTKATGYTREEVLGKTTIELDMWVDKSKRDLLMKELEKKDRLENFEFQMRTKSGNIRTNLLSTSIIHLGGAPRRFSISRDITELKNTEEALLRSEEQLRASLGEKEVLLKEIHHRVKNNLQVISGLLDLQAHHIDDPMGRELYKESQNRVITMALIHEELYKRADLSQVDFEDYIQNLCKNLMVSYGADKKWIKLDVDAEKTELNVDTAIPVGLIINELITNAFKHAFPDMRKGTISLSFRQMKNGNYTLTIRDDGIGIPGDLEIDSTTTLGMQLITVLVEQLGGSLKVQRKKGTRFTIKFKEYHEAGSVLY